MSRSVCILLLLLCVVPASSPALEWTVASTNFTHASPVPQPDGRVDANGFHTLTITDAHLWDLVIKFRVTSGKLAFYGGVMDRCSSSWVFPHGPEDTRVTCYTSTQVSPCYFGEGIWDTWTVGELQGVGGGLKTSPPAVALAQCFC